MREGAVFHSVGEGASLHHRIPTKEGISKATPALRGRCEKARRTASSCAHRTATPMCESTGVRLVVRSGHSVSVGAGASLHHRIPTKEGI